jgi:hypothetical protein
VSSHIIFKILIPRAIPEACEIWLVPKINHKPFKHVVIFQVVDKLPEKNLHFRPIPVVPGEFGFGTLTSIGAPKIVREKDKIPSVLAGSPIVRKG